MKHFIATLIIVCTTPTLIGHDFSHYFNNGHEEFRKGDLEQALLCYTNALACEPNCQQAHFNKGLVLAALDRKDEAIAAYKKAIALDPDYLKAYLMLGDIHHQRNNYREATACFEQIITKQPDHVDALVQLAKVHINCQRIQDGIPLLQRAAELNGCDHTILLDYANALTMGNRCNEALDIYYRLLKQSPDNTAVLYNIAYTLKKKGDVQAAFHYYYRILELTPDNAETHFGLSLAHLMSGNLEEGWKEYEWRWKRDGFEERQLSLPLWQGESLAGKRLFIHAEQGLGDTLQFIRYAQLAHEQGATVYCAAQEALVPLLSQCPYLACVVSLGESVPSFDYHIPLLSMPHRYKTVLETVPNTIPYLFADTELTAYWKETLAQDPNIKIGICWQGNQSYSTPFLRHAVAAKSMPLATFARLSRIPGVSLYSLQKISGTDQLQTIDNDLLVHQFDDSFDNKHGRFMDTAAVIKNLDLVITIDTSICHLAGGLGVPVWLLLPKPADWRWLLDRSDTPWYPSMQLFRQTIPGDWESVMAEVARELEHAITYYEDDSLITRLIDNAARLEQHLASVHDPLIKHAIASYIYGLKYRFIGTYDQTCHVLIDQLQHVDGEILLCNQQLSQEQPLHEQHVRLAQHLVMLLEKREGLKKQINTALKRNDCV